MSEGGWRTSSILRIMVNVNLSRMKVTCSAFNEFYSNEVQESKVITILSKYQPIRTKYSVTLLKASNQ